MKLNYVLLLTFFLIFGWSCEEASHDVYNPYTIVDPTPLNNDLGISESVMDNTVFLAGLVGKALTIASLHPALTDSLTSNIAQTRDCPDVSFTMGGVGNFPATMIIDFDNCQASTGTFGSPDFDHIYDGKIELTFNGALGSDNGANDITMKIIDSDFSVTNDGIGTVYTLSKDASINFEHFQTIGSSFYFYDFSITTALSVIQGMNQTTYPTTMMGRFIFDNNGNNNTADPTTFIDDQFILNVNRVEVVCSADGGTTTQTACLVGGIVFDFFTCGCPTSGELVVNTSGTACSSVNESNSDFYAFGRNSSCAIDQSCDNEACLNIMNGGWNNPVTINSCGS